MSGVGGAATRRGGVSAIWTRIFAAASCAALLLVTPAAQAWTTIATGVSYQKMSLAGPRVAHVTRVDLCAPGVRMRATAPGEGPRTVSSFGTLVGGAAAINGDWPAKDGVLPLPSTYPRGLSMGNGVHFKGTVDPTYYGFVAFGHNQALHSHMSQAVGGPLAWMQEVVSGQPTLVWGGAALSNTGGHCPVRHPRTAVALDKAGTTFYMIVVDGRTSTSIGMTCNELAAFALTLKVDGALLQDGGGSSTMWLKSSGVVNKPSDGYQRSLVNHWAVLAGGSGPPRSCATREIPAAKTGIKRHVPNPTVFAAWKFGAAEIITVSNTYLSGFKSGPDLLAAPALIKDAKGTVYLKDVYGSKRHVPNPYTMDTWRFDWGKVKLLSPSALAAMPTRARLTYTPVLVKGSGAAVYVLDFAIPPLVPPKQDSGVVTQQDAGVSAKQDVGGGGAGNDVGVFDEDAGASKDGSVLNPNWRGIDAGVPPVAHAALDNTLSGGCSIDSRDVGAGTPMWGWWPLLLLLLRRRADSV